MLENDCLKFKLWTVLPDSGNQRNSSICFDSQIANFIPGVFAEERLNSRCFSWVKILDRRWWNIRWLLNFLSAFILDPYKLLALEMAELVTIRSFRVLKQSTNQTIETHLENTAVTTHCSLGRNSNYSLIAMWSSAGQLRPLYMPRTELWNRMQPCLLGMVPKWFHRWLPENLIIRFLWPPISGGEIQRSWIGGITIKPKADCTILSLSSFARAGD